MTPEIDFETYSEAGYTWSDEKNRWESIVKTAPHGIGAVGAAVYSEHPSTEVLCLAYDLHNGSGPQLWIPPMWPPSDLFAHIAAGGLVEAHNSIFEFFIWNNVCVKKYGWPALPIGQLRCSAAKVRAFSIPGKLEHAANILPVAHKKIADGKRLIDKFSVPRNPTKKNPARRIYPQDDPFDAANMYKYCIGDIVAEGDISAAVPELSPGELALWRIDQKINTRGVYIDKPALESSMSIIDQAADKYTRELRDITGGEVSTINEIKNLARWLKKSGVSIESLRAESVEEILKDNTLPPGPRRVLEIRAIIGSASVKKLYAMRRFLSSDSRLRDLFSFCGALHTGRWAGKGPQPQNMPASLPDVDAAFAVISTRDLTSVEKMYGDPVAAISGCLRGLYCAAPGHDLICSDYKAIEAVVLAELAGETWRQDVFRGHGMIYETSASKITGIPFEEFIEYKKRTGEHHPLRKKIGKIAELASGYQGGIGAWKRFGADEHMTDDEIKEAIKAWRKESPNIVNFWYRMEEGAIDAIQNPGKCYSYRGIGFGVKNDILHIRLPSGRLLHYHQPRLHPDVTPWGKQVLKISYMGWTGAADKEKRPPGWNRINTYGGCLTENIVQAVSRDILANAIVNLEAAGYPIVLHVHDEPVAEVPGGFGSIEEFERIMTTLPAWADGWAIKAGGGWRGKRYRK